MARLSLSDLLDAVQRHPSYPGAWEDGVPARQSLRIILSREPVPVRSEVFPTRDGLEVVLDIDEAGNVAAIEFL